MAEAQYRQIAEDLREKIESGEIVPGSQLPTQIELMDTIELIFNRMSHSAEFPWKHHAAPCPCDGAALPAGRGLSSRVTPAAVPSVVLHTSSSLSVLRPFAGPP
jgi:Bacterial regulatory proteins, gntR family